MRFIIEIFFCFFKNNYFCIPTNRIHSRCNRYYRIADFLYMGMNSLYVRQSINYTVQNACIRKHVFQNLIRLNSLSVLRLTTKFIKFYIHNLLMVQHRRQLLNSDLTLILSFIYGFECIQSIFTSTPIYRYDFDASTK